MGGTTAPVFSKYLAKDPNEHADRPRRRTRQPNVLRKMCMFEKSSRLLH
jgi:hypothetical protein